MIIFPWPLNTDVILNRSLSNCIKFNDLVCYPLKAISTSEYESFSRLLQSKGKKNFGAYAPIIISNNSIPLAVQFNVMLRTHSLYTLYCTCLASQKSRRL